MKILYIYILDTLADWEISHIIAELNSKRFFKNNATDISIKTVSYSKNPIKTMGGIEIFPDVVVDDIVLKKENILLLPGADTWSESKHENILEKARDFISLNATVGAICGATVALANKGMLDNKFHTSNGEGYIEMFSPNYRGQKYYMKQDSVSSKNIITAGSTNSLAWTRDILKNLDVFNSNTLEAWYNYFNTGDEKYFFDLIETLSPKS